MCQKRQDPGDLLAMGTVLLAFRLESLSTTSKDGRRMPYDPLRFCFQVPWTAPKYSNERPI